MRKSVFFFKPNKFVAVDKLGFLVKFGADHNVFRRVFEIYKLVHVDAVSEIAQNMRPHGIGKQCGKTFFNKSVV